MKKDYFHRVLIGASLAFAVMLPGACMRTPHGTNAREITSQRADCVDTRETTARPIDRMEPPCWWTGMKTPLQLMVHGDGIGACDVRFEGLRGVKVQAVHRADSPNYLFIDI